VLIFSLLSDEKYYSGIFAFIGESFRDEKGKIFNEKLPNKIKLSISKLNFKTNFFIEQSFHPHCSRSILI
jgi:hypothetical protein